MESLSRVMCMATAYVKDSAQAQKKVPAEVSFKLIMH